jgi:hypothetical protein
MSTNLVEDSLVADPGQLSRMINILQHLARGNVSGHFIRLFDSDCSKTLVILGAMMLFSKPVKLTSGSRLGTLSPQCRIALAMKARCLYLRCHRKILPLPYPTQSSSKFHSTTTPTLIIT